jgi:ABC-2 type transport system ATP-binding protein
MDAIRAENLSKEFRTRRGRVIRAVQEVNLSVPGGQVFGFLGPNGAGKTTTIKMACGLILPTAGRVWVAGLDVARLRGEVMKHIGVILEGTRNIYWMLSAWDNLLYFGHLKGMYGKRLKGRSESLLHSLDLWERRNDMVNTFSRGMQQKLAIGCALIADPALLLLDEPTLGLDVQAARAVKNLVRDLVQNQGKTVILTTHQLNLAQELCEQVAIIHHGRILTHEPIEMLLRRFRGDYFELRLAGPLPPGLEEEFPPAHTSCEGEETMWLGALSGQAQIYRLLERLRQAEARLISFRQVEPNLEDIFIQLVGPSGQSGWRE